MKIIIFLVLLFIHSAVNAVSLSTEDIFATAEKYTLELAVDITTPFIDDEPGSYSGTAFIIDKERGWAVTNAHVVGKSPSVIRGKFKSSKFHPLKKVYIDPVIDMAIIHIDPKNIPTDAFEAKLDCNTTPKTGHPVGTYGHPWETSFTATRGIVSGTTYLDHDEWLQVDAPINHGNSGGPLISLDSGLVLGISSALVDGTEGLGFALPIGRVCTVLKLLKNNINPSPPNLGVVFFQHDENEQLKVADVISSNIDLQEGDVITSVLGVDVNNELGLIDLLRGKVNASAVIDRKGEVKKVTWEITPKPTLIGTKGIYFSGMVITLNNLVDKGKTGDLNTWTINSIANGTLSQSYKLAAYDLIENVDSQEFSNIEDLYAYFKTIEENDDVHLVIKKFSTSASRLYDYHDLEMTINGLKMVEIK